MKTYQVVITEDPSGKVIVERVQQAKSGEWHPGKGRTMWKPADKRSFTRNFLNAVNNFVVK